MKFSQLWNRIPQLLFPRIERVFAEELTEEHKKIIAILEVVRIEECIHQTRSWTGPPAYDWVPFARFFVAKAILNVAATCDMIARVEVDLNLRRILGWELGKRLPDESAFSRVNATLSSLNIPLRAQEALANAQVKDRGICHTAHDSEALKTLSGNLGLVPIIDENPRRSGEKRPMEPDRARRYKDRTMVERFFARLKDEFGARMIYVRGNRKVFAHLMYGVLALMADQLLQSTP